MIHISVVSVVSRVIVGDSDLCCAFDVNRVIVGDSALCCACEVNRG